MTLAFIPLLWTFHHVVKASLSTLGGALSDRAGRRRAIVLGWAIYAAAYLGFARAQGAVMVFVLFAVYGVFHALTEGPEKAFVADLSPAAERGRGFGLYHAVTGAMILPGNLLTGLLWQHYGPAGALMTGAALAAVAGLGSAAPRTRDKYPRNGATTVRQRLTGAERRFSLRACPPHRPPPASSSPSSSLALRPLLHLPHRRSATG